MKSYSELLKETFLNISTLSYEILEVFNTPDNNIRQVHEDAISSIILKKIAKLQEKEIFVKTKSLGTYENRTGIDFDIWIGENDEKYIRLLVQAKSFLNKTNVNDKYNIDKLQCNKLIEFAKKKHKAFPLYFFYQYINDKNLKTNHFPFLDNFKNEHSSITFTSALHIQKQIIEKRLRFSDIHKNNFAKNWKNDIYEIFENADENICLPLYLLHDISPSKIEKFQNLISTKNNSLGFFFLFLKDFFFEDFPFEIHKINSKIIEQKYGINNFESEINIKNLLIINNNF